MVPVVTVGVSVHQESQASQEALDPREQQVWRDHLEIMDLKDPWAHEETKAMKEPVEDGDHQVPKELKARRAQQVQRVTKVKQVLVESKVSLALRDLKDLQVQLVPMETRVIQVLVAVKVPQVPRVLQDRLVVIGNSAFLRIWTMEGTLD